MVMTAKELVKFRRERVLNLITLDPDMYYSDIGKKVGITKERVRQLLKQNNLFTPRHGIVIAKVCSVCGKVMTGTRTQLSRKTCSDKCAKWRPSKPRIALICCRCGKRFTTRLSWAVRSRKHYCSRKCYYE